MSHRLSMVLLPAMLCDEELYRAQIAAFQDRVEPRVFAVAETSMAGAASTVLRQAPPRFLLVGTSYGGSLALEVAATAPARVMGLWLMGCNPGPPSDANAVRLRNVRVERGEFDAVVDELAATIAYGAGPYAGEAVSTFRRMARRAGPTVFLRQNASLLGRADRRADLARIGCPTLLVWGREDCFAAVRHGVDMCAHIPGARLTVLDGCGHLPTLERPEAAVEAAREWLGLFAPGR